MLVSSRLKITDFAVIFSDIPQVMFKTRHLHIKL
jgi:hypothetical protein